MIFLWIRRIIHVYVIWGKSLGFHEKPDILISVWCLIFCFFSPFLCSEDNKWECMELVQKVLVVIQMVLNCVFKISFFKSPAKKLFFLIFCGNTAYLWHCDPCGKPQQKTTKLNFETFKLCRRTNKNTACGRQSV